MSNQSPPIRAAIVIAAGGRSSRIGGDKPGRLLADLPLLEHALSKAARWNGPVAVALQDPGQVQKSGIAILLDRSQDIGPVAALESAFRFAVAENCTHVLMIGCDMPFLPDDLLSRLGAEIGNAGAALPVSGDRPQPMAGLWKVDAAALEHYLAAGQQSLWRFAQTIGAVHVAWPVGANGDLFADIDDQEALEAAERRLNRANSAS